MKRLERFLAGRLCQGLVDAYAIGYANNSTEPRRKAELADTFRVELLRHLNLDAGSSSSVVERIWSELTAMVRLSIDRLKNAGDIASNDLILLSQLDSMKAGGSILDVAIRSRQRVSHDAERVQSALDLVQEIRRAGTVVFSEMLMPHAKESHRVKIDELYVVRMLELLPIEWQSYQADVKFAEQDTSLVAERDIIDRRFVLLGNPGAGKTTFVRKLLNSTCKEDVDRLAPLVLELKSWAQKNASLTELLTSHLKATLQVDATEASVGDALALGLGLVVFDGLDEVVDVNDRRNLVLAIEAFAQKYPLAKIVVSSRREGYQSSPLNPLLFSTYRIPGYTQDQVEDYVRKWFRLMAKFDQGVEAEFKIERFIEESVHAAELRSNPLMLSLLCLLYQYEGYIPENRSQVYEECSELLFRRWDRIRKVDTAVRSDIRGHHLVEEIASHFFRHQGSQGGERELVLRTIVKDFLYANIVDDEFRAGEYADEFLQHCAGRAWLLTLVGTSTRGERLFGFTHRTFMEYFAACHIARFASGADELADRLAAIIKSEASEVICQLAIDRFGERNANGVDDAFRHLIFGSRTLEMKYNARHLAFAVRALEFLRPTPRTVRAIIRAALRELQRTEDYYNYGSVAQLRKRFTDLLDEVCKDTLAEDPKSRAEQETAGGARLYLSENDLHKRTDLHWLAQNARRALVARLLGGAVPLREYRTAVGVGCLSGFRGKPSAEGSITGPLAQALSMAGSSGFMSKALEQMLRVVSQDPAWLAPMAKEDLIDLYEHIAEISDWQQTFLFGARRPVLSQHIVGFSHLCSALVVEGARCDSLDCVRGGLRFGFGIDGQELPEADDRPQVADLMAGSPYITFNTRWRRYLSSWVSAD